MRNSIEISITSSLFVKLFIIFFYLLESPYIIFLTQYKMLWFHNINQHNSYQNITILHPHMSNKLTMIELSKSC